MLVIVCSFTPGERLNLGPLDRRLISWVLRLCVRSVTSFTSFVAFGEWALLVSPLLSRLEADIELASFDVLGEWVLLVSPSLLSSRLEAVFIGLGGLSSDVW